MSKLGDEGWYIMCCDSSSPSMAKDRCCVQVIKEMDGCRVMMTWSNHLPGPHRCPINSLASCQKMFVVCHAQMPGYSHPSHAHSYDEHLCLHLSKYIISNECRLSDSTVTSRAYRNIISDHSRGRAWRLFPLMDNNIRTSTERVGEQ